MHKLNRLLVGLVTMLALAAFVRAGEEKDEKVALDKVPASIMDAIKAKYTKAKVVSAAKGDVDGTKVYELQLEQGKKKWEVSYTLDGKFFGSEEIITKLPAKVKEAFDAKFPGAKVSKMEKETTGEGKSAKIVYEIFVERGTDNFVCRTFPRCVRRGAEPGWPFCRRAPAWHAGGPDPGEDRDS